MSLFLNRPWLKAIHCVLPRTLPPIVTCRRLSDENQNDLEFTNTTILVENGFNVHELPVIVRKLKDLTEIESKHDTDSSKTANDNINLIRTEFHQCIDLRDVFTLLSKCTKITPNIALVAIERIHDLERSLDSFEKDSKSIHINLAKGAILDKLLKVVMKTEETQTILNILNASSSFMEPYKYKFCDEIMFRVIDNKLSIEQICELADFLIKNKIDPKYAETIDKLWVGFIEKNEEINEVNIVQIFSVISSLKSSKKTVMTLLEQKLSDLWYKINIFGMQEILNVFICEGTFSLESYPTVGRWFNTNIHLLDEDSLLNIITKFTRLNYTDFQIEAAVEKYMRLKGPKIQSQILIVGILNYCMHFKIRNEHILNLCCEYFLSKHSSIPHSFLCSIIYPLGFLNFNPIKGGKFWNLVENIVNERFVKLKTDDLCSIILSFIYTNNYPLTLVNRVFSSEYLGKINNVETMNKLHLIDTALSLEYAEYSGPRLPKYQCNNVLSIDGRIRNIINKIKGSLIDLAGGADKLSTAVLVPYLCSDETYLIDIMFHPSGLGSNTFNWKSKCNRNENTALLIHLPDHFCSNEKELIGPQMMRKKHLKLLGLKVVSLKYSDLSQLYTTHNDTELISFIRRQIHNAEE